MQKPLDSTNQRIDNQHINAAALVVPGTVEMNVPPYTLLTLPDAGFVIPICLWSPVRLGLLYEAHVTDDCNIRSQDAHMRCYYGVHVLP